MALPTRTAPVPGDTTTPHGSWLMLAVLLLGQFMCIIDVLVTNVAMPSIAASLHASGASLQLVVGGYTIAYAMLLITGARLGDRYGRRRTYLAGVVVFTAASLACALAPDSQALIGFRLVQGAGAAVLVPQVFSIIQLNFTGPARARALSAYAAVLSAGAVTGLVLGGVVVTANLFGTGWRPVFAINVPIGIVLAAAVPRLVPPDAASPGGAARPGGPGRRGLRGAADRAAAGARARGGLAGLGLRLHGGRRPAGRLLRAHRAPGGRPRRGPAAEPGRAARPGLAVRAGHPGRDADRVRRAAVRLHAAPAGGPGPERAAGRAVLPAVRDGVRAGRVQLTAAARRGPPGPRPGRADRRHPRLPGPRGGPAQCWLTRGYHRADLDQIGRA